MTGLPLCTGLVRFAAANIAGLVGHLSLRGLSALQFIGVLPVTDPVSRPHRVRLADPAVSRAEQPGSLDLNRWPRPLRDLRAAAQQGGSLDHGSTGIPDHSPVALLRARPGRRQRGRAGASLPALQQLWNWNTGQTGTLNLSGLSSFVPRCWRTRTATAQLISPDAPRGRSTHTNSLGQSTVDAVLATVNGWGISGGLNLAGNAAPSSTGLAARRPSRPRVDRDGGHRQRREHGMDRRLPARRRHRPGRRRKRLGGRPGADANINSGDLVRTDAGSYRVLYNANDGDLPANYRVTMTIAGASKAGGFLGVMGRWTAGNGVAAFLNANSSSIGELYVMDANNYLANAVAVTADSAIPASWTNSGSTPRWPSSSWAPP